MSELDRARTVAAYARQHGLDLFEQLNQFGQLATDARIRGVQIEALEALRRSMDRWDAHEYLRRIDRNGPWSPQQLLEAVRLYIGEYIEAAGRGELP